MPVLVSILIPAYNAEHWLAETLQSALAQTWPNIEIIVVDDGSTDGTLSVAKRFASQGVKVVSQTNQGGSSARNKAFSISRGEYIQWLDADDLLAPDKIALQMKVAETLANPRTVFSSSWGMFYYRASKARFAPTKMWRDLSSVEWLNLKMGQCLYMPPATWLISRELTQLAGDWDTQLTFDDDGEYFCRVAGLSAGVRFVPEARSFYRSSGSGSMSYVGESNKKMESLMVSMKLHLQHLLALENTPQTKAAALQYIQDWSIYFLPGRPDLFEEAQKLAAGLGGSLQAPRLWNRKYEIVQKLFGWNVAKRFHTLLPRLKSSCIRFWDKTCFKLQKQNL